MPRSLHAGESTAKHTKHTKTRAESLSAGSEPVSRFEQTGLGSTGRWPVPPGGPPGGTAHGFPSKQEGLSAAVTSQFRSAGRLYMFTVRREGMQRARSQRPVARSVLECGDGVCAVTALAPAAHGPPARHAAILTSLNQSGDSAGAPSPHQNAGAPPESPGRLRPPWDRSHGRHMPVA